MATKLPYVVECRSTYVFFEPIAAFNVDSVAIAYAKDCAKTNPMCTYKVVKNKKVLASNEAGSHWTYYYDGR